MKQATLPGTSGSTTPETTTPDNDVDNDQALRTGWKWSDSLTDFVDDIALSPSLMVCPGHLPIGDVNLDAAPFDQLAAKERANFTVEDGTIVPDEDAHPAVGGEARQGDMLNLPIETGRFHTTIADPPWKAMSKHDRRTLLEELSRVTRLGGILIVNATWISNDPLTELQDLRLRQCEDFWGGPSTISVYRKYPANSNIESDLKGDLEDRSQFQNTDPTRKRSFLGRAIAEATNTDPRFVDASNDDFCCPHCNHPELGHLHREYEERDIHLYQCTACGFRAQPEEIVPEPRTAAQKSLSEVGRGSEPIDSSSPAIC